MKYGEEQRDNDLRLTHKILIIINMNYLCVKVKV